MPNTIIVFGNINDDQFEPLLRYFPLTGPEHIVRTPYIPERLTVIDDHDSLLSDDPNGHEPRRVLYGTLARRVLEMLACDHSDVAGVIFHGRNSDAIEFCKGMGFGRIRQFAGLVAAYA